MYWECCLDGVGGFPGRNWGFLGVVVGGFDLALELFDFFLKLFFLDD